MDKIKNIFKNSIVKYSALLLVGLLLGYLMFGANAPHEHQLESDGGQTEQAIVWTCSMHPQIKSDKPGKCPLCAMDLTPLKAGTDQDEDYDDQAIVLSKQALALANIQTTRVSRQDPIKDISLYGTIEVDERLQQNQTSHVNGRIEKLYVNSTGEQVKQGQLIARVYSPDLLNAQQELLEAEKLANLQPLLLDAAKEKLRLYKVSDKQIQEILASKKANAIVNIYANTSGIVVAKNVSEGDYISVGSVLYNISNLTKVWAIFDAYESDLPFLKVNDKVSYTLQGVPGVVYQGKISFINPILDPSSRTAKVRVETDNKDLALKPSMYATATINAPLNKKGDELIIPASAVLWTGKRSIVYVKQASNSNQTAAFLMREIDLGPSLGDSYVVMKGLNDQEEIVTNGVFVVDASAQLEGKTSMMNNDNLFIDDKNKMEQTLEVAGNCSMCKSRIETAVKTLPGIGSVTWSAETKQLQVSFDKNLTDLQAISKAIAHVGHQTNLDQADMQSYGELPSCCLYKESNPHQTTPSHDNHDKKEQPTSQGNELHVSGNCGMCKKRIESAALSVAHVTKADWNVDTKMLDVTFDSNKTSMSKISKAIALVGHDTALDKAQAMTYNSLHGCCQYER